jgi:DHA1 family tetracycline resistance protein-like MFS transporter
MTPQTAPPRRPGRAALGIVYLTVFLDLLGFGIILPSLPYYAKSLGAGGLGLGILLTSYSLAQLLGAAFLGRLSDRLGRRPVLLASLAGASAAMIASGLAETLFLLCAARALAGLFGGSIATAQAYVADVTEPGERARYMGLVGASVGAGFVFGPALGAAVIALGGGFPQAAFLAAALAAANLAFAFFKLPESRRPGAGRRQGPAASTRLAALARPGLWQVFWATFLVTFAFVSMETAFAYFGQVRFGLDAVGFGKILAFVGVVVVIVQGGLVGRLASRFPVGRLSAAGCLLLGLGLLLIPASPGLGAAAAALGLLAAGQGLAYPTLATLASRVSGDDEQGWVLGLRQSMAAAARAVGPVAAGALYDARGALPFWVAGVLALVGGALVFSVTPPAEPPAP